MEQNTSEMDKLIVSCLAVTAGGTTCWELAFMEKSMITIVLSENQVAVTDSLAGPACYNLRHHLIENDSSGVDSTPAGKAQLDVEAERF